MLPTSTGSVPYPFKKGRNCVVRAELWHFIGAEGVRGNSAVHEWVRKYASGPIGKNQSKIDILIGYRKSWKSLLILWDVCTGSFSWEFPYIIILHDQVSTGQYLCFTGQGNQRLPVLESFQMENGVPCLGRGLSENCMFVIRDDANFRKKKIGERLFHRKNIMGQSFFERMWGDKNFFEVKEEENNFWRGIMMGQGLFWRKKMDKYFSDEKWRSYDFSDEKNEGQGLFWGY